MSEIQTEREDHFHERLQAIADNLHEQCECVVLLTMEDDGKELTVNEISRGNAYTVQALSQAFSDKYRSRLAADGPGE